MDGLRGADGCSVGITEPTDESAAYEADPGDGDYITNSHSGGKGQYPVGTGLRAAAGQCPECPNTAIGSRACGIAHAADG